MKDSKHVGQVAVGEVQLPNSVPFSWPKSSWQLQGDIRNTTRHIGLNKMWTNTDNNRDQEPGTKDQDQDQELVG